MYEVFKLSKHGTVDTDQYDRKSAPLIDNEYMAMTAFRFIPVLDFDLAKLAGKVIDSAVLSLQVEGENYPLEVDVTSISQDWQKDYVSLCNNKKDVKWINDKWFTDVIMSNGHSMYFRERTEYDKDSKILKVNIPAALIYAMINRQSYGFGLIDAKSKGYAVDETDKWRDEGWTAVKKFNVSEEKGYTPQLEIEYSNAEYKVPEGIYDLQANGQENPDSFEYTGAVLNWTVCPNSIEEYRYYNIYFSENEVEIENMAAVPKYFVPEYNPQKKYEGTEIGYLKPCTTYWFAVTVANGIHESEPIYTKVQTPGVRQRPAVERITELSGKQEECKVFSDTGCSVYVLDEMSKVNPVNGNIYVRNPENKGTAALLNINTYKNKLFDGKKVCLKGVPGEKLSFQFVIENKSRDAQQFTARIIESNPDAIRIELYKIWYIKSNNEWYPEVAVPVDKLSAFDIPFTENKIPEQRFQAFLVDIIVPGNLQANNCRFSVELGTQGTSTAIPVEIEIIKLKLEKPDFIFELNGYVATPNYMERNYSDAEFSTIEEAYHTAAYKHGMSINILPYSHFGTIQEGFSPKIEIVNGVPKVTDWSEWDAHFGKYLDGSYLLNTYGKKVPITHMYLPFFENWPMPINEYHKIKADTDEYPQNVNEHKVKATTVENDFQPGYREGIKTILKEFIRHIDEKGWNNVVFQYFYNNKHFYKRKNYITDSKLDNGRRWLSSRTCGNEGKGTSWWLLDEPYFREDWEAIAFYGKILKEAQQELNSGYNVKFRVDISMYNFAFDFLDGILDTAIVGSDIINAREDLTKARRRRFNEDYWTYGSWNEIDGVNSDTCLWIIDSYLKGCTGIIPWYNYGIDENYEVPAETAVFYPGQRFGLLKPALSLRLKNASKALELLKYLETFKKAFGYTDAQMKAYVTGFIGLKGEALIRFRDDAGLVQYSADNSYWDMEALKENLIRNLLVLKNS